MSLSTLHEVPLLRIFYYLPMEDLFLRVNLVCHRWNDLMLTACTQRRSLVLITGDRCRETLAHFNPFGIPFFSELKDQDLATLSEQEDTAHSARSLIKLSALCPGSIVRLTNLFPNIISLTLLGHNPVTNYSFYFQLLWSTLIDQLVTLKIIFPSFTYNIIEQIPPIAPSYFWNGIFDRLTGLTKLKNVSFFYDHDEIRCQVNLMCLRKFEKFNFYLPDKNIELGFWESLRRFASRRMCQLGILNCLPKNEPTLDYDDDTQLATTFTHLTFNQILNFDIDRFQNVTTVTLSNFDDSRPLSVYFLPLSHLPHLIHVILQLGKLPKEESLALLASSPKSEVELTSVKVVTLHSGYFNTRCTSSRHYPSVENDIFKILLKFFPKIQYFSFFAFDFGCCTYCFSDHVDVEVVLACLRRKFRRLKSVQLNNPEQRQLPLLTHIEINIFLGNIYRKWSIEEL